MEVDEQIFNWIEEYARGEACAETVEKLETALQNDAALREEFIEYLNIDLALANEFAYMPEQSRIRLRVNKGQAIVLAALVAVLLFGVWMFQPYATITSRVGSGELQAGTKLTGKKMELERGILEMRTARGAVVVIEAPAAFEFESAQLLRLYHGRVAANVPESAHGFTVLTPNGQVIDLGTEFGVDVPANGGDAEIHVFEGEVIAKDQNGDEQNLRQGEAFSLDDTRGKERGLRSAAFVRPAEFALLHSADADKLRSQSDELLAGLRADPDLIALLDFESNGMLPEGKYRMVQGRWPGLQAPEFVELGDHIELDVGGGKQWPQLSMAAWVRLDRLGAPYQSLLHTDSWSQSNPGQVHWMVTQYTTMRLALYGNLLAAGAREKHGYPDSITRVLPEKGRWVHLATVYDSDKKTVRFFFNGNFDSETRQELAHPARLGPARIGNWDIRDRTLSGRIDELIILGRTMEDREIKELFATGNPYRS